MQQQDGESGPTGKEDLAQSREAASHAKTPRAADRGAIGQKDAMDVTSMRAAIDRELGAGAVAAAALMAQRARAGDIAAAKMVLERVAPIDRDRRVSFELRPINNAEEAVGALGDVLRAMGDGQITLAEARMLVALVSKFLDATKDLEFDERLRAIEALLPELDEKAQSESARLRAIERYIRERPGFADAPNLVFMSDNFAVLVFRGQRWPFNRKPAEDMEAFLARILPIAEQKCGGLEINS
ncbi:hypothetical protein LMG27198_01010 [Methylocystis echinoides]|uniref:Uncharacterized protein n=2 Tax=Methylocystis echinoides TaxID=29468 RepID=A0A9W6GQG8_9HYPH|nr:hypothetical protein LMG27198_01010 [Methylocystis echinoides]